MTAIRKTILQITYSQHITNLTTDYCTSNDRFGLKPVEPFANHHDNGSSEQEEAQDEKEPEEPLDIMSQITVIILAKKVYAEFLPDTLGEVVDGLDFKF